MDEAQIFGGVGKGMWPWLREQEREQEQRGRQGSTWEAEQRACCAGEASARGAVWCSVQQLSDKQAGQAGRQSLHQHSACKEVLACNGRRPDNWQCVRHGVLARGDARMRCCRSATAAVWHTDTVCASRKDGANAVAWGGLPPAAGSGVLCRDAACSQDVGCGTGVSRSAGLVRGHRCAM